VPGISSNPLSNKYTYNRAGREYSLVEIPNKENYANKDSNQVQKALPAR